MRLYGVVIAIIVVIVAVITAIVVFVVVIAVKMIIILNKNNPVYMVWQRNYRMIRKI